MARSLIICPTHDHADTLFASIASVQAQHDTDWELVVICDGAPDRSIEILSAISASDARVRYVVQPKGERYGEIYRDPVIRDSSSEFIYHIGDDDLWADQHLNTMTEMLGDADMALQGGLEFGAGGTWTWNFANMGTQLARDLAKRDVPVLLNAGLNNFAVRRSAYLKLAQGWTPAPKAIASDVNMIMQYLRHPEMRIASSAKSSFFKLPSRLHRRTFDADRRLAELMPFVACINRTGEVQKAQTDAVIGKPVMRALFHADAGTLPTLSEAMTSIGVNVINWLSSTNVAVGGAKMAAPLTPSQTDQCEMAWLMLRCEDVPDTRYRLKSLTRKGLHWLVTPYLEMVGRYDVQKSLRIANIIETSIELNEIACAYRIRTQIQIGDLDDAARGIKAAESRWPDAGWLRAAQNQLRHASNTTQK